VNKLGKQSENQHLAVMVMMNAVCSSVMLKFHGQKCLHCWLIPSV